MCSKTNKSNCDICLNKEGTLINVNEADDSKVKWSSKLTFCVPEVNRNYACMICSTCAGHLNIACSFRKLCLQSYGSYIGRLSSYLEDTLHTDIPKKIENENESDSFTCYNCNNIFTTKSALNDHLQPQITCHNNSDGYSNTDNCKIIQLHNPEVVYDLQTSFSDEDYSVVNENPLKIEENSEEVKIENVTEEEYKTKKITNDCDNDGYSNASSLDYNKINSKLKKSKTKSTTRVRTRITSFKCNLCNTCFNTSKKLIGHSVDVHGLDPTSVKPYACDKCEGRFSSSSNLVIHKDYHVGDRSHMCKFCGKGFITKNDLNIHEKQHLNKREYKCSNCPKNFNTHKDLRTHRIVVHTDPSLWNYVCSFCPKRFPMKSSLDRHVLRHTGDRQFGCHICEKRFIDKFALQKHIKSHSNVREFKCEYCDKEYKAEKILKIHKTRVHGIGNAKVPVYEKKYLCHICSKAYFAKNKLTRHIFSHTGEKPYNCYICEKRFTDKSYVKQHLKTVHNIIDIDENTENKS